MRFVKKVLKFRVLSAVMMAFPEPHRYLGGWGEPGSAQGGEGNVAFREGEVLVKY